MGGRIERIGRIGKIGRIGRIGSIGRIGRIGRIEMKCRQNYRSTYQHGKDFEDIQIETKRFVQFWKIYEHFFSIVLL